MIPSNAALVGAYWEQPLERLLEQRRVAGQEPLSEQRLEGQPGYSGESLVHLHLHRAPISATQPTDLLLTDIRAPRSRAMDILATRDTLPTPVVRAMDTLVIPVSPVTPYSGLPGYGLQSDAARPAYPGSPGYGYQSRPLYPPDPGSGYGSPGYGYPSDRASEDWSPGTEYGIEPSS
jgi:hypothetical protein